MVNFPYKHSYSTQKLWESNISLFAGKKRILAYPFEEKHWEYSPVETKITTGQSLISSGQKHKDIDSYDDLISMGFQITIARASGKFFKGQKVQYLLKKRKSYIYDLGRIPNNHKIEYDVINKRIRLTGKNSDGKWIYFETKAVKCTYTTEFNPFGYNKPLKTYDDYLKSYSPFTIEEEQRNTIIDELPVMISESNKLVCIPQQRDTPIIGIVGERRTGKTILMHGINDRVVNKWHKKAIMANDIQGETGTWCLAWDTPQPIKKMVSLARFGESPHPLPMVYLYQKTNDLKSQFNEVCFETSIPFKESMVDYENFLHGKPEWQFEKSGTYFRNLILDDDGSVKKNGLCSCKSNEDIKNLVFAQETKEIQEEIKGRVFIRKYMGFVLDNDKVRYKIWNVMKDICNTQIFDITNNLSSTWSIEMPDGKHSYYPWLACILADLEPSMVTTHLRGKHYFPQWFNFFMNSLFEFQKEDKISLKNKYELYIFLPELQGISGDDRVRQTLNKMVNESGMARISFVYDTQNVEKIPEDIKLNTNYLFTFHQKKQQASLISRDFDLLNYKEKELIKLNKFECIAIGNFVLYDTDGNREVISDEPIRGTILPSLSVHQAPKITDEDN